MSFRKYAEYKKSGVEWLGEVPKHWEVKRLKFCVQLTDQKIEANREKPLPYVGLENIQSWTGKLLPIDPNVVSTSVTNRFGKGMTLFGKLRPYLAKACNPDFEGLCSTELLVFKSTGFDRRLLLYLLLTDGFIKAVDSSTYGAKMPRANWDFIGNCIVPVPPLEEQKQIATFLDKETTKIDTLIDKQEQLITLLQEKRQAVISHVVTRGLDPNVKMKDSGIEWLGEVPEHWKITQIKYVAQINPSKSELKTISLDTPVTFLPMESIGETGGLDIQNSKPLSEVVSAGYTYLAENDVIIAKITPCFENGKGAIATGLLNGIAFATTEVVPFRCFRINNQFLYFLLSSSPFRKIAEGSMYGAGGQKRVSDTFFANYKCCIPPKDEEQKRIIAFLDKETTKIDTLIEKCETAIELLKERRTALIAAAVTGKIDVRSAV